MDALVAALGAHPVAGYVVYCAFVAFIVWLNRRIVASPRFPAWLPSRPYPRWYFPVLVLVPPIVGVVTWMVGILLGW